MKSLIRLAAAGVLSFTFSFGNAAVIYFADDTGKVGQYDDVTTTVSAVGDVSASFSVSQVIGIAWDAANNRILVLDRNAPAVYAMNPTNGATTLLFNPGISLQGGAVVGSTLYGIDESSQTVESFDLGSFANQNLSAAALSPHSHAMGVNPANGQLYFGASGNGVYNVSATGVEGSIVVGSAADFEDVDYYGGDFLVAEYSTNLSLVNGTSGAVTEFLSAAQIASAGLTGSVSGVAIGGAAAVASEPASIPTLSQWGMILLGLLIAASGAQFTRRARK